MRSPVIVVGRFAFKFARNSRGRASNLYEAKLYRSVNATRRALLCPVLWVSRHGAVQIMRAAKPLADMMSLSAINDYIALRRSMPAVSDEALFVSSRVPFARLPSRLISDQISLAIEATGMRGRGLSPATVHRSVAGSALKAGHGGRVAASAGGYNLLPFSKPVAASAEEMSDLIERHHPMNGMPLT